MKQPGGKSDDETPLLPVIAAATHDANASVAAHNSAPLCHSGVVNSLPALPCLDWARHYSLEQLLGDLVAGTTVGLMVVPQALAYAVIAELPYEYGLFSSFGGVLVYAVLGMSKDVTVGPTAIMSLLVATEARVGGLGLRSSE